MPDPMKDNVFKFVVRPPQLLSAATSQPGVAERHGQISGDSRPNFGPLMERRTLEEGHASWL